MKTFCTKLMLIKYQDLILGYKIYFLVGDEMV